MAKDWTGICEKYKGKWVAFEDDEETVIASAKDLKTTLTLSKKHGNEHPIVFRVPDGIVDFVGYEISI